ncbi:hypothetical protein TYRP_016032 [Tyrophagus putrescentiae]|nr:hypothetical protein TYRP_016032 [Tyrophagus putrescentiae]
MFRFNFVQMLSNHFYIFFTDLDPVKYAKRYHISRDHLLRFRLQPSEIQSKINFNFGKKNRIAYVFPLLIMTLASRRSCLCLGMFMTLSIYICLIFKPHYEFSWLMFLFSSNNGRKVEIIQNGSFLEPKEAEGIFQLQAKTEASSSLCGDRCFNFCRAYLRVKQKLTVEQLTGLEKQEFISSKISTEFWSFFRKLNSKTLIFQKEVESQNRLWSIYLSIYFVVYMADICYLSYTFFFVPSTVGFIADVLILAAGNFAIILFYVTLQCSKIVNSSEMMYRQMMRMAMRRFEVDGSKKMLRTSLKNLLEVEQKAAEHADQSKEAFYSFTLVTGHQINSALFQSVATYTLMFFMIVFKDNPIKMLTSIEFPVITFFNKKPLLK